MAIGQEELSGKAVLLKLQAAAQLHQLRDRMLCMYIVL